MSALSTAATVVGSTLAAAVGRSAGLFPASGPTRRGLLRLDDEGRFPGGTVLMTDGRQHDLVVRVASLHGEISTICLKFPDLYGAGRDQDFLFVSSADGAPLHHVAMPTSSSGPQLYSSLWLYLAGLSPVLFGVRAESPSRGADRVNFSKGEELSFVISPPVGSFRQIGVITLGEEVAPSSGIRFRAGNCGGNLRALPPARFYHDSSPTPSGER